MRALRPDKLTLAGLHATLALYRAGRADAVPAVRMIARSPSDALRAARDADRGDVGGGACVEPCMSTVGGGAMPTAELPSFAITLRGAQLASRPSCARRACR